MMDLAKQTFSTAPEYIIAGTAIGITQAVKAAAADIEKYAPVILTEDGKVTPLTDKTKLAALYGIAADSAEKDGDAVIWLSGEFFADDLTLATGITAADIEVAFRNIGIYLK